MRANCLIVLAAGLMLLMTDRTQSLLNAQAAQPAASAVAQPEGNAAAPLPAPAAGTQPAATTEAIANPDQWRYVWHNDQWWYYTPDKTWLIWDGTAWQPQNEMNARGTTTYGYGYTPYWSGYRGFYGPGGYSFNYSDGFGNSGSGYVGPGGFGGYGSGPGFSYGWGPGYGWTGGVGLGVW